MSTNSEIKTFILQNYLFTDDQSVLSEDDSLIQKGIVDSTGMLELVNHLEDTYGFKVADEEMVPENLDSVSNIVRFIERKRAS
jgi:acyl carrier protein